MLDLSLYRLAPRGLGFVFWLLSSPTLAQVPETESAPSTSEASSDTPGVVAPSPQAEDDPSQALIADAVAEYDAARYREAQALFQRAHALAPSARTLRGVGMASFELGQYVVALRALRAALMHEARPLSDAQRRHVEGLVARTEVFVATLNVDTEGASPILIDGEAAVFEEDGTVLLDPGRHVVSVSDASGRAQTLEIHLVGGLRRTLIVRPQFVSRGIDPAMVSGISLLAAAGLSAVAAIATGSLALDHQGQVARACDGFTCPGSVVPIRDRAQGLALAADVLGSVAAVLGAAGAVLLSVSLLDSRAAVSIDASSAHAGLTVSGSF